MNLFERISNLTNYYQNNIVIFFPDKLKTENIYV